MGGVALKIKEIELKYENRVNTKKDHEIPLQIFEVGFQAPLFTKEQMYQFSNEMKEDKDLMLKIVDQDSSNAYFIGDKLRDNEDFMIKVLELDYGNVYYASERLKSLESFIFRALKIKSTLIYWRFLEEKRNDENFMFYAISKGYLEILTASKRLKESKEFRCKLIQNMLDSIPQKYFFSTLFQSVYDFPNDFEINLLIAKVDGTIMRYMVYEMRSNKEIALAALKQNPNSYEYLPSSLMNDYEVLEVYKSYYKKLRYGNKALFKFNDVDFIFFK